MINAIVNDFDTTFAALADPTRRHVVELLRDGPRRASELAERLGMSPPRDEPAPEGPAGDRSRRREMLEDDARGRVLRAAARQSSWRCRRGSTRCTPSGRTARLVQGARRAHPREALVTASPPASVRVSIYVDLDPTPRSRCSPTRSTPGTSAARTRSSIRNALSGSASSRIVGGRLIEVYDCDTGEGRGWAGSKRGSRASRLDVRRLRKTEVMSRSSERRRHPGDARAPRARTPDHRRSRCSTRSTAGGC